MAITGEGGSHDEELARLAADNVPRHCLIWTAYFFSHPFSTWPERQAFREDLRAAGFTGIGSTEEMSGDQYWHHWSHTIREADPDALRAADATAAAIAAPRGVTYDQWQIFRDLTTGELRPATTEDDERLRGEDAHSFEIARRAAERHDGEHS